MFGHPVNLTFKGSETYKTTWGACVSLLVSLVFLYVIATIILQKVLTPVDNISRYTTLLTADGSASVPLNLTSIDSLFRFQNVDKLPATVGQAEVYRSQEEEMRDFDVFKKCFDDKYSCINNELLYVVGDKVATEAVYDVKKP